MAYYKNIQFLSQQSGSEFDLLYPPHHATPISGVYRCKSCGKSVTSIKGRPLPPQRAPHTHTAPIEWQLAVKSHIDGGD